MTQSGSSTNPPITGTEADPLREPTDAERTEAIQEHLHDIVDELHHGKGSHDDPELPDGPSGDFEEDETVAGVGFDSSPQTTAGPDASIQGGL